MSAPVPPDLAGRGHGRHGVPVPFACEDDDGTVDLAAVVKKRAIQCALSRICGLCGRSLSWGVTFLGSPQEADEALFHFPPLHRECAEAALDLYPPLRTPVLGQQLVLAEWALVVTGGFELIRPVSRDGDMRVAFRPNSSTEDRRIAV